MIAKNFKDYEEFKELYVREDGKRKNAILMAFTAHKPLYEWYYKRGMLDRFLSIKDMNQLYTELCTMITRTSYGRYIIDMAGMVFMSDIYDMDVQKGICFDGDIRAYRYTKGGQAYKMKAGRLVGHLLDEQHSDDERFPTYCDVLPRPCKVWLCEELGNKWRTHAQSFIGEYTLVVDDDFESIYNTECYRNGQSMGSCMEDDGYHTFYEDAVDASAASLRNNNGAIIARCVIYNKAKQEGTDKIFRLCERQYAVGGDDLYKRLLVAKLIEGKFIDAYKPAGAGCHEPRSWVDLNGDALDNVRFSIPCHLSCGDAVSYQDSFKWYSPTTNRAYNFSSGAPDAFDSLETTDGEYRGNYDSWCEEYTDEELHTVYHNGHEYQTTDDVIEDEFRWVESRGEYHHIDDVVICHRCDNYELSDNAYYSDLLEEWFCCEDCLNEAEDEWREEHPEEE